MLGLETKSDSLGVGIHRQSPQRFKLQAAHLGPVEGFAASESQGFRAQGGDFGISNTDRRQSKERQGNRCVPVTEAPPRGLLAWGDKGTKLLRAFMSSWDT